MLLAQAVFTLLLRNARLDDHASGGMRGELKLFQRFTQLIDTHYHQHWTVPDYACELHLTESRLTDICRRFANRPPKRLIFDRQLREARRLLLFPTVRSARLRGSWALRIRPILPAFQSPDGLLAQRVSGEESNGVVIPGGATLTGATVRRAGKRSATRLKSHTDHKTTSHPKSTCRCPNRPFTFRPSHASIKQQNKT